jgi:hypothetical protein
MVRTSVFILFILLSANAFSVERYLSFGAQSHSVSYDLDNGEIVFENESGNDYSVGVGVHNQFGRTQRHFVGFGLDIQNVLDDRMFGLRALDYQYQVSQKLKIGAFIGAATVDTGASQNGYYTGANLTWQNLLPRVDIVLEFRRADGLARDTLPSDELDITRPDIFMDVDFTAMMLRWRF